MSNVRGGYEEVATIRDTESEVVAVISRRRGTDKMTCGFFKEFTREGVAERTNFFNTTTHFDAIKRLMPKVEKAIIEIDIGTAAGRRA